LPDRVGHCDDRRVSHDLAIWESPVPADNEDALAVYAGLCESYLECDEPLEPTARIRTYVEALLQHYPDDAPTGVWASIPVLDEASGPIVSLLMTYARANEVAENAAALARDHGLICFDPQGGTLRP
jgi:hypothetical protein